MTRKHYLRLLYLPATALLILLLTLGAEWWARERLLRLLDELKNKGYDIQTESTVVSLWSRSATLDGLIVKSTPGAAAGKAQVSGRVASVSVTGIGLWQLLSGKGISVRSLVIDSPNLTMTTPNDERKNEKTAGSSSFSIGELRLENGELRFKSESGKQVYAKMAQVQAQVYGISSDGATDTPLPFRFKSYSLSAKDLFYKTGPIYHLGAKQVAFTEHSARIDGFSMQPDISRAAFTSQLRIEEDFYRLSAAQIVLPELNWGFHGRRFFLTARRLDVHRPDAYIYRDKRVADDTKKRRLYNALLRDLPFDLELGTLALGKARIVYEERVTERGPGRLIFSDFDLNARNLHSGFGRKTLPDVAIVIKTRFMEEATLRVDWRFNVLDKSDGFRIQGQIANFDTHKLDPFTKPYSNLKTSGKLAYVDFDISGNDLDSRGEVRMRYDDLKVKVYRKKKPSKVNKLLSVVGNVLVKNDTDDQIKSTSVSVTRKPDASFYNFLWRNVEEGMRKIIL